MLDKEVEFKRSYTRNSSNPASIA